MGLEQRVCRISSQARQKSHNSSQNSVPSNLLLVKSLVHGPFSLCRSVPQPMQRNQDIPIVVVSHCAAVPVLIDVGPLPTERRTSILSVTDVGSSRAQCSRRWGPTDPQPLLTHGPRPGEQSSPWELDLPVHGCRDTAVRAHCFQLLKALSAIVQEAS